MDWSPQIAELKALQPAPDAVYISWAMPDIGILIRQMRSAGLEAWVVGSDGFDDPSLVGDGPPISLALGCKLKIFPTLRCISGIMTPVLANQQPLPRWGR